MRTPVPEFMSTMRPRVARPKQADSIADGLSTFTGVFLGNPSQQSAAGDRYGV
jgi:hypothetical protein